MASWVRGRHVRLQEALEPQQADRGDRYAVLEHGFASATLYLGDSEAARYSAATRQAQPMTSEPMSLGRHSSLARSTRFVPDSPVEGAGFEPSVPGAKEPVSFAEDELRGIERGRPTKVVSLRGPVGSNPSPSSGESTANLASAPRAPHGGLDPLHGRNQGAVLRSGLANADTGRELFGRPWGSGHEGFLLPLANRLRMSSFVNSSIPQSVW